MNRDDIIRLVWEVGADIEQIDVYNDRPVYNLVFCEEELERFAALVSAHEREECAQLLESGRISCPNNPDMEPYVVKLLGDAAFVIRKRGEE
jgi:hypothetical protein